jgi:hypothetical protein
VATPLAARRDPAGEGIGARRMTKRAQWYDHAMKTVSIKVPKAIDTQLSALARRRRTTKSALIRSALDDLVARRGAPRAGSALDVVRDLVGCLDGPADLSTSRARLAGFGR